MRKIPIKLPIEGLSDELENHFEMTKAEHSKVMKNAAIAQNKMLIEMMIHHNDYDIRNYDLKFSNDYHADTGCIDISFYFDYNPSDRKNTKSDEIRIARAEHLARTMQFYQDYDMEHYKLDDRVNENGEPYDCRIYYGFKE